MMRRNWAVLLLRLHLALGILLAIPASTASSSQEDLLLQIKVALDPEGRVLRSWVAGGGGPCSSTDVFEGVECNGAGKVANISLQGRGLRGFIPSAMAELGALTGLYLHYNSLQGPIPAVLYKLSALTELYLNVNLLSGTIPDELGLLYNLHALQLCCNALEGQIPMELGALTRLTVLALQRNKLVGKIPSSLGYLVVLERLDLSFNELNGSIPSSLGTLTRLAVLDITSNRLSGAAPPSLRSLQQGFKSANNPMLCGEGFASLPSCDRCVSVEKNEPLGTRPLNFTGGVPGPSTDAGSVDTHIQIKVHSKIAQVAVVSGVVALIVGGMIIGLLIFALFRRHKQKISCAFDVSDTKLGGETPVGKLFRMDDALKGYKSPVHDPPASTHRVSRSFGSFSGVVFFNGSHQSFQYDLEDLEMATNFFSDKNLLGKRSHSAVYKGVLKDGSAVAIRALHRASCKAGVVEFKNVVGTIVQLAHENLVSLKGFCCSSGKAEGFLVYDYMTNGTLQEHLEKRKRSSMDWAVRARIANNIALGLHFMHKGMDETVIHQNLSAANVLMDQNCNGFLSDGGLHRLLADDIVFSVLKSSAAHGYLAPEYVTTGRLTEKSDVYAFGVLLLQLLTGKRPVFIDESDNRAMNMVSWARSLVGAGCIDDLVDSSLGGKFSSAGATHMAAIAFACTHDDPSERPGMTEVVSLLQKMEACAETVLEAGLSSGEEYPRRQQALFAERLDDGR